MMNRRFLGVLVLVAFSSLPAARASVVANQLVDPGFESPTPLPSEPDQHSHPWFTLGEAKSETVLLAPGRGRSGSQAVEWRSFWDKADLVQNLQAEVRIQEGETYELSLWAMLAEASTSPDLYAPPTFHLAVYTAPAGTDSYRFLAAAWHNLPSTSKWTRFQLLLTPDLLAGHQGERVQIRIIRSFLQVTHRLLIDDVAFGIYQRPNVVFILADDIGYGDIGVYHRDTTGKEPVIPTPNIDRLAQEGMRFTDAHTPAALCAPTRYSVMTGNNPYRGRDRWGTWLMNQQSQFLAGQRTAGDVMRSAGYRTAFIGKLHWGGDWRAKDSTLFYRGADLSQIDWAQQGQKGPLEHGFHYSFTLPNGVQGQPYAFFENDRLQPVDSTRVPAMVYLTQGSLGGGEIGPDGWGYPDWDSRSAGPRLAERAVSFINRHHRRNLADGTDTPFLMVYASQAIHVPNTPPVEFVPGVPVAGKTHLGSKADMIYELDLQVGQIVDALRTRGLLDNTLIIFTSDNGGLRPGSRKEVDSGHDSVGGLNGHKASILEGGHRVPFVARWGDGTLVAPNTVSNLLVSVNDWVAMLYSLTGQTMPEDQAMDSANLLPILFGQQDENVPTREFMLLQSIERAQMPYGIRQGNHVLIFAPDQSPIGLYDLHADLRQEHNLIADPAEAGRIEQMLRLFLAHKDSDSPRTVPPPTGRRSPCAEVSAGRCEADDRIRVVGERTVTLISDQFVDVLSPNDTAVGQPGGATAGLIPAGTTVSSYLLHFDPVEVAGKAQISHTFDRPIAGIIYSSTGLDATDRLYGSPSVRYPTDARAASTSYRGMIEGGEADSIAIGADGRTIDVIQSVGFQGTVDQVRVLLQGAP